MQKIVLRALIILLIVLLSPVASPNLKFESTWTPKEEKTTTTQEETLLEKVIPTKAQTPSVSNGRAMGEDEVEVKKMLQKYNIILSREKKLEKIIPIEFNRIICFIELARAARGRADGKVLLPEEKNYLTQSLQLIDRLIQVKSLKKGALAQLYFFQGVSYLDLDQPEKSRTAFETAIDTYPSAKFVPSLSLYLADLDYDAGRLDKAMAGYKRFYAQMNNEEKSFSNYKMAWINLNQSRIDEAIALFFQIIGLTKSKSTMQDTILSLSVALSETYEQDAILENLQKYKISEENKLKILWGVYENFLKRSTREKIKLWENILKLEKDDNGIIRLMSGGVQSVDLGTGIEKEIQMMQKIYTYLKANKERLKKKNKASVEALGQDLEELIAKALMKYQKGKEATSYRVLQLAIDSYLVLDIPKRQVDVMTLALELLIERKEDEALMGLCKVILTNPRYASLKNRAKLLVLLSFEKKFQAEPGPNQKKFFALIKAYLKDDKADQWESVADKYYDYLVKANLYPEAEEIAGRLYKNYPGEERFLKLISIKFEQKKCQDVLQLLSTRPKLTKEQLDYKRECHLILAQESKLSKGSKKTFLGYQENILEFIKLSEGNKRNAAIGDYLANIEKNYDGDSGRPNVENPKLKELLDQTFFKNRFEPEIFPIYRKEILRLIEIGEFARAQVYLKDCEQYKSCQAMKGLSTQMEFVIALDANKNIERKTFEPKNVEFYKYLALLSPETLISLFRGGIAGSRIDPPLVVVAARLVEVDWSSPLYKNLYRDIERYLTPQEKTYIYYPSWIRLTKFTLPVVTKRHHFSDQDVMYFMSRTHNVRKLILADLPHLSLEMHKLILGKAMELEHNLAEIIKFSPIPKDLDPAKINEYQQGLDQLAQEFVTQSATYKATIANIDQQLQQRKATAEAAPAPEFKFPKNVESWNWGAEPIYIDKIKALIQGNRYSEAMFYIDYLLSISKVSPTDYYLKRSGLLLLSSLKRGKPGPMVKYLKSELELNKQPSLVEQWKKWSEKYE